MSSLPPDPYKILGVSKDAQIPEIRSAHRKLVLKCHPDKVQDPTLKAQKQDEFQKVQQAYELLSNESERAKYDDNVKLAELRKEMAKGMSANTSAPRAPRTYEVRTAEPRPDTFSKTTSYRSAPAPKMYSYNSRSYDEDIHSRANSIFEEPRAARRAASYEKPSRQDDDLRERRRREDREREREELARAADRREREREKERQAERKATEKAAKRAAEEKEARRQERKRQEKAEKEREKERRREAEDKMRRHKPAYIEPLDDAPTYIAKADKKKSSSSKEKKEDKRSRSIPRDGAPLHDELPIPPVPQPLPDIKSKITETMLFAAKYMDQSRKAGGSAPHPGLSRAQTFDVRYAPPIAVPTPPPAAAAYVAPPPPPPPIPAEEDTSRRSKSRRSSETKTRDKSSHKKSSPTKEAPMPVPPSPNVVDASPSSRHMPPFASAATSPISTSPPKYHLGRAATFTDGYTRPPPGPTRAHTFSHVAPDAADLRGRGRTRLQPTSEDSESEDERPHHRSSRHRTHSPEAMPAEYPRTRYTVSGGRTVAIPPEPYAAMYRDEETPSRKHSKASYYERPSMPSRESSYSSPYFGKVKTSRYEDVQYSNIPHRYREEYAGYA